MSELLNDLLVEVSEDTVPQRNEVSLSINEKKRDIDGVEIIAPEKKGFLSKIFTRDDSKRFVLVHMQRTVTQADIFADCEDVASEIMFRVNVKLDLETPGLNDTTQLKQLAQAFRDATLLKHGQRHALTGESTPSRIFEREMTQWLRSTYQSRTTLPELQQSSWSSGQGDTIAQHIKTEYGLNAQAKVTAWPLSDVNIDPKTIAVETKAKNSDVPVKIGVRVGCKLKEGVSAFEAPTLKPEVFEREIKRLVADYISDNLTLHRFRFGRDWADGLEKQVKTFLKGIKRVPVGFHVEFGSARGGYDIGPYASNVSNARFKPLGWTAEDEIAFSSTAEFMISDAARFESHFAGKNFLQTRELLAKWLDDTLQKAVDSSLHAIHDSNNGYAALLTHWDSRYRDAIQNFLKVEADKIGVDGSTIVATPNRPEMKLVDGGAPLQTGALKLPSRNTNAPVEFEADLSVKVESFEKIGDILNTTNRPLMHITEHIVKPALKRAAAKITYEDFNVYFDFARTDEKDKVLSPAAADILQDEVDEALKQNGLERVNFSARQIETELWRVFKRLTSSPGREIKFTTKRYQLPGSAEFSDAYDLSFSLRITGLNTDHVGTFLGLNWPELAASFLSEYEAVAAFVEEQMDDGFLNDDVITLMNSEFRHKDGRSEVKKRVHKYLDELLSDKFGLSGRAIAIGVETPRSDQRLIDQQDATETAEQDIALTQISEEKDTIKSQIVNESLRVQKLAEIKKDDSIDNRDFSLSDEPSESSLPPKRLGLRSKPRIKKRPPDESAQKGEGDDAS